MKRPGITRARVAEVAAVAAILLLGVGYVATSQPRPAATSTSASASVSQASSSVTETTSSLSTSSSSGLAGETSSSAQASEKISHVIIVLMENEEYGSVIGNASAPYQNELASRYALAGNYFAVAHPSLPNYLAIVAGSTFGATTDCQPAQCSLPGNVTTLATLLDSHHLSWKEYAESMPANCSQTGNSDGLYVPKHNPFVYFGSITGNNGTGSTSAYCDSHVVSMDQFYVDLQADDLPNYSFITPNICDDAHSCPLSTGDQWLSTLVPKIINSSSFSSTALFIVYDEGADNDTIGGGGHVLCILVSPFAKRGYVSSVEYSHYSLLATAEAIFDLGSLGRNDASASPMYDLFVNGLP